jgi:hypothetical protein
MSATTRNVGVFTQLVRDALNTSTSAPHLQSLYCDDALCSAGCHFKALDVTYSQSMHLGFQTALIHFILFTALTHIFNIEEKESAYASRLMG